MELTSLPGHELVLRGIDDLARGIESQEALLVSIGAPRLRQAGIEVPSPLESPEHRLYDLLAAEDPRVSPWAVQRACSPARQLRTGS